MSIVSGAPIVLIGPGSEWFWSMAQFVVVAVTLLGIYYQLRTQRATNAFEQLNRIAADWGSEPMLRARLRVGRATQAGEIPSWGATVVVGDYWESVGSLVRGRHIDARVVDDSLGAGARFTWAMVKEAVEAKRIAQDQPDLYEHFEWLVVVFDGFLARSGGSPAALDRAGMLKTLEGGLPALEDRIRMLEESRLVPAAPAS